MLKRLTLSLLTASNLMLGASCSFGIGVVDGSLEACDPKPNCVSTSSTDSTHAIEPWSYDQSFDLETVKSKLVKILDIADNMASITVENNYIHAEFKSKIFKFVDDVEFLIDEDKHVIQVRSASRVGYFDFKVNRKRVEKLKKAFYAK